MRNTHLIPGPVGRLDHHVLTQQNGGDGSRSFDDEANARLGHLAFVNNERFMVRFSCTFHTLSSHLNRVMITYLFDLFCT